MQWEKLLTFLHKCVWLLLASAARDGAPFSGFAAGLRAGVELTKAQREGKGLEFDRGVQAPGFDQGPCFIRLAPVQFHFEAILCDQQQLAKRRDGPVELCFCSAVVVFGAGGENLHQQRGVGEGVDLGVRELGFTTDHGEIRVGIEAAGFGQNPHIGTEEIAGFPLEVRPQQKGQVDGDEVVLAAATRDGEDLAVVILAAVVGRTFEGEVLVGSVGPCWQPRHTRFFILALPGTYWHFPKRNGVRGCWCPGILPPRCESAYNSGHASRVWSGRNANARGVYVLLNVSRLRGRVYRSLTVAALMGSLLAQTPQSGIPVFRSTTRLVEVNVVVRDKDGPVAGLTQNDFTISDRGKKQEIAFFTGVDSRGGKKAAAAGEAKPANVFSNHADPATEMQPNVTVVLLDGVNTDIKDQFFAKKQAIQFLRQVLPTDRIAVYALGVNLYVLHDFTTDAQRLIDKLNAYQGDQTGHLDASHPATANTGDDDIDSWINNSFAYVSNFYLKDRVERTTGAMEAIASHIRRVPGRKNLIWVSGSFPFSIGADREITGGTAGGGMSAPTDRGTFTDQITRATRALNDANIAVYPVDARGLIGVAPPAEKMSFQGNRVSQRSATATVTQTRARQARSSGATTAPQDENLIPEGQESMRILAGDTGGRAFLNTNDIQNAIRRAVDDGEVSYSLGFYVDGAKLDSKFHDLKVEVKRKGLDVRFRRGYLADPIAVPEAQRTAAIQTAAWSPLDAAAVRLSVRLSTVNEPKAGLLQVEVTVDPNDLALEEKNGHWSGAIDFMISPRGADGGDLGTASEVMRLNLSSATMERLRRDGMTFSKLMEPSPETAKIRVVVADRGSGRIGSVTVPGKVAK